MNLERVRQAVLENKAWTAVTVFLLLMVLGVAGLFLNATTSQFAAQGSYGDHATDTLAARDIPGHVESDSGSYVEVQEADVDIESQDAESDAEQVRSKVEEFEGHVESSSKRTTESHIRSDLTVKIPSKKMEDFVSQVRNEFEVDSYSVENYRLYTQRQRDELDILNDTLRDYSKIKGEVRQMDNTGEKLDLLMQVTEKELEAKEKQGMYERQLSDKEKRGKYSTVDIRIEEEKKVDLVPEDIGERFREEVREMIDNVVETLMDTVTGAVGVFFLAIKYIVYLAVIAIPASFAYRVGKRIYNRIK